MRKFLSALLLAGLMACGSDNKLSAGEVVDLEYDDPDVVSNSYCGAYDSNGFCKFYVSGTHEEPAKWSVRVTGFDADGEARTEWHGITEHEYNTCTIGDHWEQGKGCDNG